MTASDPPSVGRFDEEHLRRFLAARDRGDGEEMRRWWHELVIDMFDRMDGLVGVAHKGRLNAEEHELALQLCMIRFATNLMTTFQGTTFGQLVNACRTLARQICIDVQRTAMRERRHGGLSLDAGWDADGGDGPTSAWEAEEAVRRAEREERSAEVQDFLAWALPQIGDDRRTVLEMTFHGAEIAEIVGEMGITRDNAYTLRSRGLRDLTKLKERYDL
jgi:DNA-directed RNA polymerase specialized sigma24 family protein